MASSASRPQQVNCCGLFSTNWHMHILHGRGLKLYQNIMTIAADAF